MKKIFRLTFRVFPSLTPPPLPSKTCCAQPAPRSRAMHASSRHQHQRIATVMQGAAYGPGALDAGVLGYRLRLTNTIPAATPPRANISRQVSGSLSSSTPNTSANTGVKKVKVAIWVAG